MTGSPLQFIPPTLVLLAAIACAGCNTAPTSPPPADTRPQSSAVQDSVPDRPFNPSSSQSRSRRGNHSRANSAPGDFDFYLLNLSWSPEYCATHSSSPECPSHPGFVVHGLWPQNTDGTYPEHCSNAPGPSNPGGLTDLLPTTSLVQHEWTTHGTCSGLAADPYFAAIRTAFREIHIPATFTGTQQPAMLSPDAILKQVAAANPSLPAGSFALSCGNNHLTALEVCFDKSLHPEVCQGVRSCRANAVKITSR